MSPLTELDDGKLSTKNHIRSLRNLATRQSSPYLAPTLRKSNKKHDPDTSPAFITVNGHVLQPTIVFDTFYYWCAERNAINDRRRAGQPYPWTHDTILRDHFFCNVFRVLDKTSQYLIQEVIQKGSQVPSEIVFRVLLFNTFLRIETWEYLVSTLGPLTWASYSRKKYFDVLKQRVDTKHSLYTGAFFQPGPNWDYRETWRNHIMFIETIMTKNLTAKLQQSKSMADTYALLAAEPGMGPFNSFQLVLNLSYTSLFNFSPNDFVVPGLGAEAGLRKMFGKSYTRAAQRNPSFAIEVMRYLQETQGEHFHRLSLDFTGLGPDHLPMDLADIEHSLCEVDKYSRSKHPEIIDQKNGRKENRRKFAPSSDLSRVDLVLPDAWSHPNRKVVRPCNKIPKFERHWTVERIVDAGEDSNGEVSLKVRWFNYAPKDDTWESLTDLLEDAPEAVDEYWRKTYGKPYTCAK
ncbi:hypothetical protein BDP27DRAFT_1214332 [Rhodocollybia butyracea]|uniref:Chromo domain-containing protein n=1 Tax=Rhodocollybia butyracea TaxID=206335 RepID=A0A9P5Q3P0_9AGAR|nr:hypothetical protein BDP27DRAFT_1214332 [Rhodocollybia butyracea]